MKLFVRFFLVALFGYCLTPVVYGQEKETVTKIPKFKPPVVKTFLGVNQNGATVTVDEGNQLVGLPLKITDAQNHSYPISSYRFLYRKKSYVLNDETGKRETTYSITADRFDTTPLPELWIRSIQNQLQPGDQLYFFDIVVKDKQGRDFFAPELKITTK